MKHLPNPSTQKALYSVLIRFIPNLITRGLFVLFCFFYFIFFFISFCFLFFSLFSKILTMLLLSFNLLYLSEIQYILNIIACTKHVKVKKKKMLTEWSWVFLSLYILSSFFILIKTSIIVQATFFTILKSWWRFIKTEMF